MKILRNFYELKSRKNGLEILGNLKFDEIWPGVSLFHLVARKNKFLAKVGRKLEFLLKVGFELIYR
jgi:hypothetical protein